jgi:hypothetical protein
MRDSIHNNFRVNYSKNKIVLRKEKVYNNKRIKTNKVQMKSFPKEEIPTYCLFVGWLNLFNLTKY